MLIHRNIKIYENFYSKVGVATWCEVLIFHEGNITADAQAFIQRHTPNMTLKFWTIQFYETMIVNYELCPPNIITDNFGMGYKNMCYFWSIDFLKYLKDYEYVFRIDEDCFIEEIDPGIFDRYRKDGIKYSSPHFVGADEPYVTVGMERFFERFMKGRGLVAKRDDGLHSPYTNVMIVDIGYFKNNPIVRDVLKEIERCGCIFSNRWGDLPIWGYILTKLIDKELYLEDKQMRYYHASHDAKINMTN